MLRELMRHGITEAQFLAANASHEGPLPLDVADPLLPGWHLRLYACADGVPPACAILHMRRAGASIDLDHDTNDVPPTDSTRALVVSLFEQWRERSPVDWALEQGALEVAVVERLDASVVDRATVLDMCDGELVHVMRLWEIEPDTTTPVTSPIGSRS